ncbi:cysteine desulfurase family protein [Sphingopyxis sp.]|jgi:cysteine desulfurase|uniref:cysteine desulfurase family protein n=1 Tax=Sphingopyxis sp. TaxID=1908224 RepID=UPI002DE2B872|nr:cysteine desulfurase family protein [Sphingopyxis sp.]
MTTSTLAAAQRAAAPIYLDHNATTPLDPAVLDAMLPYFTERFGNPASVEHGHGNEAAQAVERAREQVAALIGARPAEIIFTGSCTESNNLAILGFAEANPERHHLVTSAIEHPAVLEPARALAKQGWQVTVLPVDGDGRVDPGQIEASLTSETGLVSIMGANNEIGTLQPLQEIGGLCAERGIPFHSDLAQALATGTVDVERDSIHLASLSAHKLYGPKGIGALYVRSRRPRVRLSPLLLGGGQERGLRPGTLNVPLIVGFGEAAAIAKRTANAEQKRLRALCDRLLDRLRIALAGVELNGHPDQRLPMLSLSIEGVEPLALLRRLREVVSLSASSACATDKVETSHVLIALHGDTARARQAFRIAPGRSTTTEMIDLAADEITEAASALQGMRRSA